MNNHVKKTWLFIVDRIEDIWPKIQKKYDVDILTINADIGMENNNHPSCLSFCPFSSLRQWLHNPAMRPLPRLENEQKSFAILDDYFSPSPLARFTSRK